MDAYNFITLNAGNMIIDNNYEVDEFGDSGDAYAIFQYDLSDNGSDIREIVLNEMEQQDNAMYYQLLQCDLIQKHIEEKNLTDPKNYLREHLVYIDFESVFKNKNINMPLGNEYKKQTREALEDSDGKAYLLRWMFDPDNGIQLSFDGKDKNDETKEWRKFVPFDKSGSMSRSCQITFIDEKLKEEVDNKLLLDMCFYKKDSSTEEPIPVVASKYYAYRGLYLSTGYRINHCFHGNPDEELSLNQETVIVIPDEEIVLNEKNILTAKPEAKKGNDTENHSSHDQTSMSAETKQETVYTDDTLWLFEERIGNVESNLYDGEGLICSKYAKYINAQLLDIEHGFDKISHSFQIRMPFAKGMLHEVNFIQYMNEQLADSVYKADLRKDNALEIKDVFGIRRDLRKAKIILTESMLKCTGWLKKWRYFAKNNSTLFKCNEDRELIKKDPMEYYFSKMEEYNHALYVTNTDARFSDYDKVPLNYQFLSTLALPPEDFEKMIQRHIADIDNLAEDILKRNLDEEEANADEPNAVDDDDNPLQNVRELNASEKCMYALRQNPAFANESKFKNILKTERRKHEKHLCLGRLKVCGEQRFLSGDLLELLRFIYRQALSLFVFKDLTCTKLYKDKLRCKKKKYKPVTLAKQVSNSFNLQKQLDALSKLAKRVELRKQLKKLKAERLYEQHFHMPNKKNGKGMELYPQNYYAFFRNPHLSRNEQCLLKPYTEKGNPYKRYFSRLTGVVMVSGESLVAMALSGADFDGDLVKVVGDKRIVMAIRNSAYKVDTVIDNYTDTDNNVNGNGDTDIEYKRTLPVIVIPKLKASSETDSGTISFKTIKNTFSNQVGQISNTAIKYARKEYEFKNENNNKQKNNVMTEDEKKGNSCAGCTVITGLEIDACKTGVHPKANIQELQTSVNFHDPFLTAKEALKVIYKKGSFITPYVTEGKDGTLTGHYGKKNKKIIDGLKKRRAYCAADFAVLAGSTRTNIDNGDHVANIDWLPGRYLKYLKDTAEGKTNTDVENKDEPSYLFTFQKDENWKNKLIPEIKIEVEKLVGAYVKIRELARKVNRLNDFIKNQKYIRHVRTMLKIQYDNAGQKLLINVPGQKEPCEVRIQDALDQTYATIYAAVEKNAENRILAEQEKEKEKEPRQQTEATEKEPRLDDVCREEIKLALKRFIKRRWQYAISEEQRRDCIFEILNIKPEDKIVVPDAMVKLLSNFNNEGYMIFYYVLKDIQNHYNTEIDSDAYIRNEKLKKSENTEDKVSENIESDDRINKEIMEYYDELYRIFSTFNSRKNANWNGKVVKKCRKILLKKIFTNNTGSLDTTSKMDMALQYVFSVPLAQSGKKNAEKRIIDSQRNFLWNVFTKEEILRNVYKP